MKEAAARIKINNLLESPGWRVFADASGPANTLLEPTVALTKQALDALGEDFEKTGKGFIDFLLLNQKGFPIIVLEAKAENKGPLAGKEQARKYAKSQNCRFVILSTATCIFSETWNAATHTSSPPFPRPHPLQAIKEPALTPIALTRNSSGMTTWCSPTPQARKLYEPGPKRTDCGS